MVFFGVWFLVFSELFYFEKLFSRWVQHLVSLSDFWTADGIKSDHPQVLATESHLRLDYVLNKIFWCEHSWNENFFDDFNNLYILYRVGVSTYFLTSWFLTSNPRDRSARNQFQSEKFPNFYQLIFLKFFKEHFNKIICFVRYRNSIIIQTSICHRSMIQLSYNLFC